MLNLLGNVLNDAVNEYDARVPTKHELSSVVTVNDVLANGNDDATIISPNVNKLLRLGNNSKIGIHSSSTSRIPQR